MLKSTTNKFKITLSAWTGNVDFGFNSVNVMQLTTSKILCLVAPEYNTSITLWTLTAKQLLWKEHIWDSAIGALLPNNNIPILKLSNWGATNGQV